MTSYLKHKRDSICYSMLCNKYHRGLGRLLSLSSGKIISISLIFSPGVFECHSSPSSSKCKTIWQEGLGIEHQIRNEIWQLCHLWPCDFGKTVTPRASVSYKRRRITSAQEHRKRKEGRVISSHPRVTHDTNLKEKCDEFNFAFEIPRSSISKWNKLFMLIKRVPWFSHSMPVMVIWRAC